MFFIGLMFQKIRRVSAYKSDAISWLWFVCYWAESIYSMSTLLWDVEL